MKIENYKLPMAIATIECGLFNDKMSSEKELMKLAAYLLSRERLIQNGEDMFINSLVEQIVSVWRGDVHLMQIDVGEYTPEQATVAMDFLTAKTSDELFVLVKKYLSKETGEVELFRDDVESLLDFFGGADIKSNEEVLRLTKQYVKDNPLGDEVKTS